MPTFGGLAPLRAGEKEEPVLRRARRIWIKFTWSALLIFALFGCKSGTNDDKTDPDYSAYVQVDTVKTRKDPKGGFFGPSLRDLYVKGEDTPVVFCDAGPDIPTDVKITIFYREVKSMPSSSACKLAVAVVEGQAEWVDGKPMTREEIARARGAEEHFIPYEHSWLRSRHVLRMAWANPKPVGPPCPDTTGDLSQRYKGQKCSIAVVDSIRGTVEFVNWTVVGRLDTSDQATEAVIAAIRDRAGAQYVVEAGQLPQRAEQSVAPDPAHTDPGPGELVPDHPGGDVTTFANADPQGVGVGANQCIHVAVENYDRCIINVVFIMWGEKPPKKYDVEIVVQADQLAGFTHAMGGGYHQTFALRSKPVMTRYGPAYIAVPPNR